MAIWMRHMFLLLGFVPYDVLALTLYLVRLELDVLP